MNAECQAAVNALVVTGMDPAEAEHKVLALYNIFPAATGIDLVMMILNKAQPVLPSELKDISHLFGAGTVTQQVTTGSKAMVSGVILSGIQTILFVALLVVVFAVIGALVMAFCH